MPKYKRQSSGNIQVTVTTKKLFQIESSRLRPNGVRSVVSRASFGSTYTKIGTIQRRLAWPLRKDDTQNREAFHIFSLTIASRELPTLSYCDATDANQIHFNRRFGILAELYFCQFNYCTLNHTS